MVGIGSPRMWERYVGVMGVHTVFFGGVGGGVPESSKQLCSEENVETPCLVSVGRVTAGSTKSEKSMKNVYFYSKGNKSRHSVKESRKGAVLYTCCMLLELT